MSYQNVRLRCASLRTEIVQPPHPYAHALQSPSNLQADAGYFASPGGLDHALRRLRATWRSSVHPRRDCVGREGHPRAFYSYPDARNEDSDVAA